MSGSGYSGVHWNSTILSHAFYLAVEGGVLSAGVRLGDGPFGLGATWSQSSLSASADIVGRLPHPFFFDTLRTVEGTQGSLTRDETAIHLSFRWLVRDGEKIELAIFRRSFADRSRPRSGGGGALQPDVPVRGGDVCWNPPAVGVRQRAPLPPGHRHRPQVPKHRRRRRCGPLQPGWNRPGRSRRRYRCPSMPAV